MNLINHFNSYVVKPLWLRLSGNNFLPLLGEIEQFHQLNLEKIREWQFDRIKLLVAHAYKNVPYYRSEWKSLGIEPEDITCLDDFKKMPVLTKQKIRDNPDMILSRASNKANLLKSGTGGTTDSPIIIFYDTKRKLYKEAEMCYFRKKWFFWNIGDKVAYLWGAPQDIPHAGGVKYKLRNLLIDRSLFLFSSLMNEEIMGDFVEKINRFQPDIIQGYSNPVYILAEYILKRNLSIHSPKSIVLTAEPCHPYQRKIIEKALKTEVFTFYGCREGGYVACECNHHNGYHINCSSIYMEFINEKGEVKPGELGDIVFTDLFNYDMPFIRYQIGDIGIPDSKNCVCGSPLPVMKFFAGRETDVFVCQDGSYVPGVSLCDRIIEDCRGIQQLQFIQNNIDELIVKIVKGTDYSDKDMVQLDSRLANYFKGRLVTKKIFVDNIPKEKSGKTRFCISNVRKNF